MRYFPDTIAAPATPTGTSAIAVVRVSGSDCAALAEAILGCVPEKRKAHHGDYRDASGEVVDDCLFTFFEGPHSYTGEDTLEISLHGNPFLVRRVLDDLGARGCRAAEPGEFTRRAFLNGRMDLSQAEAVMDLIHARSERAAAAANRQLRGGLGAAIEEISLPIVACLAAIEAQIDFPEEDIPAADASGWSENMGEALRRLRRLASTRRFGDLLRDGIRTVIVGETNAGKSSLLNRLVGRERALVSTEPGTTRDYLEEPVTIAGYGFRLIDTAGFNPSASTLERRGIDNTLEQVACADLVLWVVDRSRPAPTIGADLDGRFVPDTTIVVVNKSDLPRAEGFGEPAGFRSVTVSTLEGSGIEALEAEMARFAGRVQEDSGGSEGLLVNSRHMSALAAAGECVENAIHKGLRTNDLELAASDLRGALAALGEIAGAVDNESVLDELFARFCIGK